MEVDPDIDGFSHLDDPQSWNAYAYARNNPLRYIDPTGQAHCELRDSQGDGSPQASDRGAEDKAEEAGTAGGPGDPIGTKAACDAMGGSFVLDSDDAGIEKYQVDVVAQPDGSTTVTFDSSMDLLGNGDVPISGWGHKVLAEVSRRTAGFPNVCSGGAFFYAGFQGKVRKGHGFGGYLGNYDSNEGWSNNGLIEASKGNAAGGVAANAHGVEGLAFIPFAETAGGLVGLSKNGLAVGAYVGTPEKFPVGIGVGAYFNISTMGDCAQQ